MKRTIAPLPLTVLLSCAATFGVAGTAFGQGTGSPSAPPHEALRPVSVPSIPAETEATRKLNQLKRGPTIDLDYPGGTFSSFLKAVQDAAAPTPVNVMTSPEVGEQEAPPVRLKGVTVDTALRSVSKQLEAKRWSVDVRSMVQPGDEVATYFLQAVPPPVSLQQAIHPDLRTDTQRIELAVFSVRDLIDPPPGMNTAALALPLKSLTGALALLQEQTAVEGPPPNVKLHEESGTLLVRGNLPQIHQVRQLLDAMKQEMQNRQKLIQLRWQQDAERSARLLDAESKLRGLDAARESLEREVEIAKRRAAEAENLANAGSIPARELEDAQKRLADADARATEKRIERDRIAAEIQSTLHPPDALAGHVGSLDARLVVYNLADLKGRIEEIERFLSVLRDLGGGELPRTQVFTPENGGQAKSEAARPNLIVIATSEQHAVINTVLDMLRGAKAGNVVQQKE